MMSILLFRSHPPTGGQLSYGAMMSILLFRSHPPTGGQLSYGITTRAFAQKPVAKITIFKLR